MKSPEFIKTVNELLALDARHGFPEDLRAAAQGRPWLSWFDVQEWTHAERDAHQILFSPAPDPDGGVDFQRMVRSYELKQAAVATDPIDVRSIGRLASTLSEEVSNFRENILLRWEKHLRSEYARLAEHAIMDGTMFCGGLPSLPAVSPERRLDGEVLGWVDERYKAMGAGPSRIIMTDLDTPIPQGDFVKVVDTNPRRWTIKDGEWVEVPSHLYDGAKRRTNPDYVKATIQDYPILFYDVMSLHVPREAGKDQFDQRFWLGTSRWVNIADAETNPHQYFGHFRHLMQVGIKPLKTDLAIVIRALRP